MLISCGAPPSRASFIAEQDIELIIECSTLFPDVLPSMSCGGCAGVRVALVSNCVANTRPLVDALGLLDLVDAAILSCEVGSVKPESEIHLHAATALGDGPESALLVDDQIRFCRGAESVGMRSLVIDRTRSASAPTGPFASLAELASARSAASGS